MHSDQKTVSTLLTTSSEAVKPRSNREYIYKLFRVKRSDGRVTTVSIDPILATYASRMFGNPKEVGKIVRKAAYEYEPETHATNCSQYVAAQLRKAMASAQNQNK
jgi:hypothetical protein